MKENMTSDEALNVDKQQFRAWLKSASDFQVEEVVGKISASHNFWSYATEELRCRQAKPHWSVAPTFWLILMSVVLSAAALLVAIVLGWNKIQSWIGNP